MSSKRYGEVQTVVGAAAAQSGVWMLLGMNRCLESDGITSQVKAHPRLLQGRAATYQYLAVHSAVLGVILSHHSQPVLCPHVHAPPTPSPDTFSPRHTSLLLPFSLYPLRVCWCWVACYAPLAACCIHYTIFDFSPPDRSSAPSRIRHKPTQCPRRREARCRAAQSKRPRHRMYIMHPASQHG